MQRSEIVFISDDWPFEPGETITLHDPYKPSEVVDIVVGREATDQEARAFLGRAPDKRDGEKAYLGVTVTMAAAVFDSLAVGDVVVAAVGR